MTGRAAYNETCLYLILILFFILCKSTRQCDKISHSEVLEKFQCENFNEIFTPTKLHEILHLYSLSLATPTANFSKMIKIRNFNENFKKN